jgi:hypothetical protein
MFSKYFSLFSRKGVTILEIVVSFAGFILLLTGTLIGMNYMVQLNKGMEAGIELRSVWKAQKMWFVDRLEEPGKYNLADCKISGKNGTADYKTLSSDDVKKTYLDPYLSNDVALLKTKNDMDLTTCPPKNNNDGSKGDAQKISASTGDSIYDVGAE